MTGLIALDIDGTIMTQPRSVPDEVVAYLLSLHQDGWTIVFVTGRTFNQSHEALKSIPFPFFLSVQNGAIVLSMPDQKVIFKHYLDKSTLLAMSGLCKPGYSDVVVYGGYEYDDRCFYRPDAFDKHLLDYLSRRQEGYGEFWEPLETFEALPLESLASTKSFGASDPLESMRALFEGVLGLNAPINRDPFQEGYYVMQTTHAKVNKGQAVKDVHGRLEGSGVVISAGDDLNDFDLLKAADIKVAMGDSPRLLLDIADIIAPPATEHGIITGLQQAIKYLGKK